MVVARHADKGNGVSLAHEDGLVNHVGHGLDVARAVFPIDPDSVKVQGREKACERQGAEARVVAHDRGDLLLVGVADGVSRAMGLEERRGGVGGHALLARGGHDDVM